MTGLPKRTAIITGGAKRIGGAITRALAADGWHVLIHCNQSRAEAEALATELGNRSTGCALYVLDEPTTGLHFDDVRKLLEVLNRLADAGHTLIVIEHNLDVIKCADWIIDLGPEGGERGGEVLATGTPEKVAHNAASATGFYLRRMLGQAAVQGAKKPSAKVPVKKSSKRASTKSM